MGGMPEERLGGVGCQQRKEMDSGGDYSLSLFLVKGVEKMSLMWRLSQAGK